MDDPRWVLLDPRDCRWNDSLVAGDAKTVAECRTSTGQRLRVAFDLAAPPARSLLYYDCAETAAPGEDKHALPLSVITAHGDSSSCGW
ncbi:hypothetical protein C2845_PM17G03260 [Panicum miliaceum]|uniref:Uncharacterized protein n=1 Tax=Panicum miliaceum TaxID=4540 RepID=A0A3L6PZW2_PANMI|nr:hypothetical protein C2845_PM17G03260 [Panicum miliaceum]